jgi:cytochrome o ubiquinol oxidase operon protein cyoD
MTDSVRHSSATDLAPGDRKSSYASVGAYTVGLGFALLLTAASFIVSQTRVLLWVPGVPVGLAVLAIAQIGVHLVFFLHLNTGPDNTNNVLALAFGVLIVTLVVGGSLWIMSNLNGNMIPHAVLMEMQH